MPDKTKWFRTDDFQICRQLKKNIYEFIEFNGADDLMISSSDIVDLSNYRDADTGEWNKEAQNILSAYYSSLQDLRESAGDDEDQIVAECIFEQTSFFDETSLQMSEDEAYQYLDNIIAGKNKTTIDRTYRDDPYEYMSQEPCDYCPYQNTKKCKEGNCKLS